MCTLSHVFEAAGLHTVVLASIRPVAEKMHPPRALYCEFPLGRPLGVPSDSAFQSEVLRRGLAMIEDEISPALVDYPEIVEAQVEALSCSVPPRFDDDLLPVVNEALGLRNAYERSYEKRDRTSVGRVFEPEEISHALFEFNRIAHGLDWLDADIPGSDTISAVHDIRNYYEEAALELVDVGVPGGRAVEDWFYDQTEAGKTIMAARNSMKASKAPYPFWFYMAPSHRN